MINFDKSIFFYEPFPHCIIKNFLENSIYSEICNEYPDHDLLKRMRDKRPEENKFEKFNLGNNNKNSEFFYKFLNSTKTTKKFYQYLNSEKFLEVLNNFLNKNYIDLRMNLGHNSGIKNIIKKILKKKKRVDFEFSSISTKNGYILPHTDGGNKLIGFVIPIIDNEEILNIKNIGTKILRAKSDKFKFNLFNKTVPFDETELIRELPFEKNQMSLHIKTFNSLHAVGPLKVIDQKKEIFRKSISIFLIK
ncbi:MAG: hypothetical protein CMB83_01325 [Flammeovirgaceae bacterium]|nr:hypothetical protein [Flammeovirgaceae bacterium]|tara:strand:+ start:10171 stop:10917 length:747 start_codon:yes stop_codon:yes gene_type:complete